MTAQFPAAVLPLLSSSDERTLGMGCWTDSSREIREFQRSHHAADLHLSCNHPGSFLFGVDYSNLWRREENEEL
ncbi:hypothetical protein DAPPUDRAFT_236279 [Daphnia pulex]|uniref:Uncharacterized protein n=1 Tax=Daphnia pulex TaxID=6669 RepID=E9G1N2_DAPPU|nr:hypothetical protein DAPPUDRAFT_236279 [Daphnia pulex]|eukprot:EFX86523.1 hypothetical protein DAPPUDRAFT_236279 [Daphnia pulex]